MTTLKYNAIEINQNGQRIYLLSMPAGDLLNISKPDIWNPELENDGTVEYIQSQGYQRNPMPRHYLRISTYISKADSILPSSVVLSSRKRLVFTRSDASSNVGTIILTEDDQSLWIVDGQHRLEGFRNAINEKGRVELEHYPLPVCLIDDMQKYDEVSQFHTINSTAKRIKTDLADRLLLTMAQIRPEDVRGGISPSKLWRLRATRVTVMMNEVRNSPWQGRVRAPNTPRGRAIISERSFSTSLKPILLDGTMSTFGDEELVNWLSAFWNVVAELMPEAFENPRDYAVQKTPGVYTFHMVVPQIFGLWWTGNSRDREGIRQILTANSHIGAYFTSSDYWRSGSGEGANTTGMGGFTRLANDIADVLPQVDVPDISSML